MAFVDEIKLHLKAGHGGNGVVRWLTLKGKDRMGPSGGDGGKGGDIYARGVRSVHSLVYYVHKKEFEAPAGAAGMRNSKSGKGG